MFQIWLSTAKSRTVLRSKTTDYSYVYGVPCFSKCVCFFCDIARLPSCSVADPTKPLHYEHRAAYSDNWFRYTAALHRVVMSCILSVILFTDICSFFAYNE
jgi:hypothetical protein